MAVKGERDLERTNEPAARDDVSEWSGWKLPSDAKDRRAETSNKKKNHGEKKLPRSLLRPAARGLSAPIPALTLGTSRGVKTTEGSLALLRPNRREREEEEVAASPGAERSILLTNCLLNGARGTMPALSPGQLGLCKARGRHQQPQESPPGEWPLPPCLHNP